MCHGVLGRPLRPAHGMKAASVALLVLAVCFVDALTNCPSTQVAGWDGQVFDLTVDPPAGMSVEVSSIDLLRGDTTAAGNIELYRREGTAIGHEFSDVGWALETSVNAGTTPSVTLSIPYNRVFSKPHETIGLYITGDSAQGNPSWILYGGASPLDQSPSSGLVITAVRSPLLSYPLLSVLTWH